MTELNNKYLNQLFLNKMFCLIFFALLALLAEHFFKDFLLFSLSWKQHHGFRDSLAMLPLLMIVHLMIQNFVKSKGIQNILIPLFYALVFLFLSPAPGISFLYILFFSAIFFLEKFSKDSKGINALLIVLIAFLVFIPMYLYTFKIDLSPLQIYFLVVLKSCLLMRVISWFIDRRVYKRVGYSSFSEFIEFIFCPIFFIFPGQIQFFLFDYFHKNKNHNPEKINYVTILWLGIWGFFLMVLYSGLDYFFWQKYSKIPFWIETYGYWQVQFVIGMFWLFLIYFQQTAGMAYQISLARLMGYDFKYDMHWPLLARSPLDYLRRHSSYVRDYIVEMGLKPGALFSMRKGMSTAITIPLMSVLSYAVFISMQTGYRPDYNRSWSVTLTMILFLMLFISLPYLHSFSKNAFFKNHVSSDNLLSASHFKSLKLWTLKDYLMWIGTLILLGIFKMFLGIAK